ncbi:MAG: hypothetical protein IPH04_21945 [Saprospirales bacterium]|nr:hypothetical protein [Saprospirales bacterium]MBK6905385.1 hypothetical protein [Saprospirales bacterium]MBK7334915.1 hypothetical protein [Saprospirales bacterium]
MKIPKIALLAAILGLATSGCTLYEDGPLFSVIPKKDRIANVWVADEVTNAAGNDVTNEYNDWIWTFTEDGEATIEYLFLGATIVGNGTWNLIDNDELFQIIIEGGLFGDSIAEYTILRLTNNEFWVVGEDGTEFHLEPK